MTETYFPGVAGAFRIVPSRPDYAISEDGKVLNLRTQELMVADAGTHIITGREERPGYVRTFTIDVQVLRAEVFPEAEPLSSTTVPAGPRPEVYNHGQGDHISSPSCSTCYLGFEATTEELRQMLWWMAVEFSEEVDATASELVAQIREKVTDFNKEDAI